MLLIFSATCANAAIIVNGSFEANGGGICDSPMFTTLPAASNCLTGWTIGGAGVDYIHNYWVAADGTHSLDMNALNPGTVQQDITTVAGQGYLVTFALAGNPDGAPPIKTIGVDVGGAVSLFTFNTTGHTTSSMGWINETFAFVASGTTTTLRFSSPTQGAFGPALDNVTIADSPIPEPGSAALMLAGALLILVASLLPNSLKRSAGQSR